MQNSRQAIIWTNDGSIYWRIYTRPWWVNCFSGQWWRHQMETFSVSPVNSPHKGQWRGTLMFSLICVWINDWVNNREAGDLRRYRAHYDVIVIATNVLGKWGFAATMTCNTYGVIYALTSIGFQKFDAHSICQTISKMPKTFTKTRHIYCLTNLTG